MGNIQTFYFEVYSFFLKNTYLVIVFFVTVLLVLLPHGQVQASQWCAVPSVSGEWDLNDNGTTDVDFTFNPSYSAYSSVLALAGVNVQLTHERAGDLGGRLIIPSLTNLHLWQLGDGSVLPATIGSSCSVSGYDIAFQTIGGGANLVPTNEGAYCNGANVDTQTGGTGGTGSPFVFSRSNSSDVALQGIATSIDLLSGVSVESLSSTWKLRIKDDNFGNVGRLDQVCLNTTVAAFDYTYYVSSNATCSDNLTQQTFNSGDAVYLCHTVTNQGDESFEIQTAGLVSNSGANLAAMEGAYAVAASTTYAASLTAGLTTLPLGTTTLFATTTVVGTGILFTAVNNLEATSSVVVVVVAAPVVTPVVIGIDIDTGVLNTDGITNDPTIIATGTASVGDVVNVFIDAIWVGGTTATTSNVWSFDNTSSSLADGSYNITAVAVDSLGSYSATSSAFALVVDTTAPSQIVVSAPVATALVGTSTEVSGSCIFGKEDVYVYSGHLQTNPATTSCTASSTFSTIVSFVTTITGSTTLEFVQGDLAGNNSATTSLEVEVDIDGDGLTSAVENGGHNGGDVNGDGIPDSQQINVASVPNGVTGTYQAVAPVGDCTTVEAFGSVGEANLSAQDAKKTYPLGLWDMQIGCVVPGASTTVVVYMDQDYDTSGWGYAKYSSSSLIYTDITSEVTFGTTTVGSTTVTTVSYVVTDGGPLDEDGLANGVIVDPAGPTAVTLSSVGGSSSGGGGGGVRLQSKIATNNANVTASGVQLEGKIREEDEWSVYFVLSNDEKNPSCRDESLKKNVPGTFNKGNYFALNVTDIVFNTKYYYKTCGQTASSSLRAGNVVEFVLTAISIEGSDTSLLSGLKSRLLDLRSQLATMLGATSSNSGSNLSTNSNTSYLNVYGTEYISTETCKPLLKNDIYINGNNSFSEVTVLQNFLNQNEGEELVVDGIYKQTDKEAVLRFQGKHRNSVLGVWGLSRGTGYAGVTTRLKINSLNCSSLSEVSLQCPVFTQYNSLTQNFFSPEVGEMQELLSDLGMYNSAANGVFDINTHNALVSFQETFSATMLKPWGISRGTGYKYKTTNKFLNFMVGCESAGEELESEATVGY